MTTRLLLWDIDGTLVRAGEVAARCFDEALEHRLGRPVGPRPRMSGKTDPQIVGEYLDLMGVPKTAETVQAILDDLAERLLAQADQIPEVGWVCPGVDELLPRLAADDRVHNGLLTGNIEPNAQVKLGAFGLDRWVDFDTSAFGSDDPDRNALVPIAMRRAEEKLGGPLPPEQVWVIGDTPRDLECARAAGVRCVLVATGTFSLAELGTLGADDVLEDLADVDATAKLLTAEL